MNLLSNNLSIFYSVLGLFFEIIGAILLARDILSKYPLLSTIERLKNQLIFFKQYEQDIINIHRNLPKPLYTDNQINEFIHETKLYYDSEREKTKREIHNSENDYSERSIKLGWIGLTYLIIGFVLQAISNMVSKL